MSAVRKVLVVDDDPVVGKSFNRVLSQKGYVVITAQNAAEALDKLREQEVDLVYTDIRMPGMDGLELAEQMKAKRPWTPVVIVTGYGTQANEARAKAAGVSAFLNKPLSPEMIEESAAHALLAPAPAVVAPMPAAAVEVAPTVQRENESRLKNIALFLAAPFFGLVYALMLPFVGMGMLAWIGGKALVKLPATKKVFGYLKPVGLFIAAPFIGLAYAVMLPFVGIAMLAWTAVQALRGHSTHT
jgi:CheY-like chemotaxis protein